LSEDFRQLAERTRDDYKRIIQKEIEPAFADFPLSGLTDRRTRGIFMEWRDKLALKSRRQADYAWTVLARVLSWSKNRGKITVNPCERGGRIYSGSRAENIWSAEQEAAFLEHAPVHLHLPLLLALWTGQRQGDLLRLPWSAYNGTQIKLRQSKTGARSYSSWCAPQGCAGCSNQAQHDHSYDDGRQAVDS
jgi:integrase